MCPTQSKRGTDSDGDFVVVWDSRGGAGNDTDFASIQGYDSNGVAIGTQFQVNTYTTSHQYRTSVDMDSDGGFIVAWESIGSPGNDSDSRSIQGQRFAGPPLAIPSLGSSALIVLAMGLLACGAMFHARRKIRT